MHQKLNVWLSFIELVCYVFLDVSNKNKRNNHFVCNYRKHSLNTVAISQRYKIFNDISKIIEQSNIKGKKDIECAG